MRVLSHPFRLDGSGAIATVEQWSDVQCQQVAQCIVQTVRGERSLAPVFGLADPVGRVLSPDEVRAAIELCEPDIRVTAVDVAPATGGRVSVTVASIWRADEEIS